MIEYFKVHDCAEDSPASELITEHDASSLKLRLVHDFGAVLLTSNPRFERYRAGAYEHVFVRQDVKKCQKGVEGLGLFDPDSAAVNQLSMF